MADPADLEVEIPMPTYIPPMTITQLMGRFDPTGLYLELFNHTSLFPVLSEEESLNSAEDGAIHFVQLNQNKSNQKKKRKTSQSKYSWKQTGTSALKVGNDAVGNLITLTYEDGIKDFKLWEFTLKGVPLILRHYLKDSHKTPVKCDSSSLLQYITTQIPSPVVASPSSSVPSPISSCHSSPELYHYHNCLVQEVHVEEHVSDFLEAVDAISIDDDKNVSIGTPISLGYKLRVLGAALFDRGVYIKSDERLKQQIDTIKSDEALAQILQLQSTKYVYKDDEDNLKLGFMAQAVQKILPEIVKQDQEGFLGIDMNGLFPIIVSAIQEMQKRVVDLSTQHDAEVMRHNLSTVATGIKQLYAKIEHLSINTPVEEQRWVMSCKGCNTELSPLDLIYCLEEPEKDSVLVKVYDNEDEEGKVLKKGTKALCADCLKEQVGNILDNIIRFDIPKLRFYEVTRPDEQALYKCNNIGDVMAKRELKEHIKSISQDELNRKLGKPIRFNVRSSSADPSHRSVVFTCEDKKETVAQLLKRIEHKCNSPAQVLYQESQVNMFSDNDVVLEVIRDGETVVFSEKKDDEQLSNLRKYQQELLTKALKENIIAVSPTGSGKTLVAIEVDKQLRAKLRMSHMKTLFITETRELANQQHYSFAKVSKARVNKISGDFPSNRVWEEELHLADVIVVTSGALINKLKKEPNLLSTIHLLIFDEAHHCTKNHPYAQIMKYYQNTDPNKLPHILGLTASPPADVSLEKTKKSIKELEDTLNSKLVLITENKDELMKFVNIPKTKVMLVPPTPQEKEFVGIIEECMNTKEKTLASKEELPCKGSQQYDSWSQPNNSNQTDHEALDILNALNTIWMRFNDGGIDMALDGLEEFKSKISPETANQLKLAAGDGESRTAKQTALLQALMSCKGEKDFRGIVFVETRQGTRYIHNFIENAEELHFISSAIFVGQSGMSATQKQKVLEEFKQGVKNVLIATSIAEEGLDFTACNIVVRYDSITSSRSLVQSRGRARRPHSQFIPICYEDSPAQEAFITSEIKLVNMLIALEQSTEVGISPFMSDTAFLDVRGNERERPASLKRAFPSPAPPRNTPQSTPPTTPISKPNQGGDSNTPTKILTFDDTTSSSDAITDDEDTLINNSKKATKGANNQQSAPPSPNNSSNSDINNNNNNKPITPTTTPTKQPSATPNSTPTPTTPTPATPKNSSTPSTPQRPKTLLKEWNDKTFRSQKNVLKYEPEELSKIPPKWRSTLTILLDTPQSFVATASTKTEAEHAAAQQALEFLGLV